MKPARLLTDHLQRIRDTDAMAGDDLQTSPLAWQQRRELLGHVAALEEDAAAERQLVLELSTLLGPYSGGSMSLEEIVARMRVARQLHAEVNAQCPPQREETGHPMLCGCQECM